MIWRKASKGAESLMTNIFHVGIDQFDGLNREKRRKCTIKAGKSCGSTIKDIIKQEKTTKKIFLFGKKNIDLQEKNSVCTISLSSPSSGREV